MRWLAVSVVMVGLAAAPAHATQDTMIEVDALASWPDAGAILVEHEQWSFEAEGKDARTWWAIHAPAGVEQARIDDPYGRPRLTVRKRATIDRAKLDALVAKLVELRASKPRPSPKATWSAVLSTHGMAAITKRDKGCGVRVKAGTKRLMLWAGKASSDLGPVRVTTSCGETDLTVAPRESESISMRPICYAHGDAWLVVYRVRIGCEGDTYEQRLVSVAKPQ